MKLAIRREMKMTLKSKTTGRNDLELKKKLKTPRIIRNLKMKKWIRFEIKKNDWKCDDDMINRHSEMRGVKTRQKKNMTCEKKEFKNFLNLEQLKEKLRTWTILSNR